MAINHERHLPSSFSLKVLCITNRSQRLTLFCLVLLLLSASLAYAEPVQPKKIGIECGVGIPYGWLFTDGTVDGIDICRAIDGEIESRVNLNTRFGIVGWYGFYNADHSAAIGPEIGLLMSSKQQGRFIASDRFKEKPEEIIVTESHIQIPMYCQGAFLSSVTGEKNGR
ncbi:MAG: hypothetical protein RL012_445 [Bacteroidota bacterium]|jgi:hypothetical protein